MKSDNATKITNQNYVNKLILGGVEFFVIICVLVNLSVFDKDPARTHETTKISWGIFHNNENGQLDWKWNLWTKTKSPDKTPVSPDVMQFYYTVIISVDPNQMLDLCLNVRAPRKYSTAIILGLMSIGNE